MARFEHSSIIAAPAGDVFAWHERPGAFERLAPPWEIMRVLEKKGTIRDGDRLKFEIRKGPLRFEWEALHRDYRAGVGFTDVMVRGPMRSWTHRHEVQPTSASECRLVDRIEYEPPGGIVLGALAGGKIARDLERLFAWRHGRTARDVLRHSQFASAGSKRIVVAGASGLVGTELCAFLQGGGHHVDRLVRRAAQPGEIAWDPDRGQIDAAALEGADAIVHLGGVGIAARFTESHKRAVRESRISSTTLLSKTIAAMKRRPEVFVCASAVGYYGDRGAEMLTEDSPAGDGFLPEVCREWEAACEPARDAGVRVVNTRIGIVLSPRGGALKAMLLPFQLGGGGVVGSGEQFMSWIALDDLVGVLHASIFDTGLGGAVNAVGPQPATNREFTRVLGRVLSRPTVVPAPAFAIELLLGEMGQALLLGGNRALPARLESRGFAFLCPNLEAALRWELGR